MTKKLISFLFALTFILTFTVTVLADEFTFLTPVIKVNQTSEDITISYDKVEGAEGYIIYYSNKIDDDITELVDTKELSFTTTKLDVNNRYFFTVSAYGTAPSGEIVFSDYSEEVSNIENPKTKLTPPVLSSVKQDGNTTIITFKPVTKAAGYTIYYATSPSGKFEVLANTKSTTYKTTKLKYGGTYYFKVAAYEDLYDLHLYTGFSSVKSVKKVYPQEKIKTYTPDFKLSQVDDDLMLEFREVPYATSYIVYYQKEGYTTYKRIGETSKLSYKNDFFKAGTKYTFKIRATATVGGETFYSQYSEIKSIKKSYVEEKITTYKPTFKLAQNNSSIVLEYDKIHYATSYIIYCKKEGDAKYKRLGETTKLSYKNSKFKVGTKYYFKVRAVSKVDDKTFYSQYSSAKSRKYMDPKVLTDRTKIYKKSNGLQFNHYNNYDLTELNNLIKSYDDPVGFYLKDLETGKIISYNADKRFATASTVKLGYCLYVYKLIESGKASYSQKITYKEEDYVDKSGNIQFSKFGTQYTLKDLLYRVINASDNAGYHMLRRTFGSQGYINMLNEIGCSNAQNLYSRWGELTPRDLGKIWEETYKFKNTSAGKVFWNTLVNAQFNFIKRVLPQYTIPHKSGFNEKGYHDSGIVHGNRKYIMVIMTTKEDYRFNKTVKTLDTFMKQVNESVS